MIIAKLVEASNYATTPSQWEEQTLNQLYLAVGNIKDLEEKWGGKVHLTPHQLRGRGGVPEGVKLYDGGKSYLVRLREEKAKQMAEEAAAKAARDATSAGGSKHTGRAARREARRQRRLKRGS